MGYREMSKQMSTLEVICGLCKGLVDCDNDFEFKRKLEKTGIIMHMVKEKPGTERCPHQKSIYMQQNTNSVLVFCRVKVWNVVSAIFSLTYLVCF